MIPAVLLVQVHIIIIPLAKRGPLLDDQIFDTAIIMRRLIPLALVVFYILSPGFVDAVQQRQHPQPPHQRNFFRRIIRRDVTSSNSNVVLVAATAAAVEASATPLQQQQRVLTSDDDTISAVEERISQVEDDVTKVDKTQLQPVETEPTHLRPAYVRDLLLQQEQYLARKNQTSTISSDENTDANAVAPPIIYYFGLGSNMLRSKLENRGNGFGGSNMTTATNATTTENTNSSTTTNNNKIDIISMEPAYIRNYRLSFNLRGFCPLEPGMGSLEPIDDEDSRSKPLHSYEEPECHGALIALTLDNYERVMRTEGVGPNVTHPSYEEIVITAIPYNTSRIPVTAIALRARSHVRLRQDPSPSQRYMDILRQGAAELQLRENYQMFLQTHPVQQTPPWLQRMAVYNLICTMTISSKTKWRGLSKLQSFLLYTVYIPCGLPQVMQWQRTFSNMCMGSILFPGACIGRILQWYCTTFNKKHSPMMQRFISMMDISSNNSTLSSANAAVK